MLALHMKLVSAIVMILTLGMLGVTDAAPRVAVVRIKELYTGLPATAELARQVKEERSEIAKDQRAVDLRRAIAELQELKTNLTDKKSQADESALKKLARSYELKVQETRALQQEFENFRAEEEKRIVRREVTSMRSSLKRIMETANRIAKERGYDLVLEDSGNTNTGLPFILYAKQGINLTADVKAALQDADRAAAKPEENPKTETKP